VVDFYCDEERLVVEVDGGQHSETRRYDEARTAFLKDKGLRVLRFWNNEVLSSAEAVLEAIWHELHSPSPPTPLPKGEGSIPRVEFEVFEPKYEKEVPLGTVSRAKATCPCCNTVLPPERVRAQLFQQRGGADVIFDDKGNRIGGARLLAVVTLRPSPSGRGKGEGGRHYRLPNDRDYEAVWKAQKHLQKILDQWESGGKKGLCPVPDELLPPIGTLGFRVQRYGMLQWGDLFTARQKVGLTYLRQQMEKSGEKLTTELLAFVLNKLADKATSLCRWETNAESMPGTFSRPALPIIWDFCEAQPFAGASGSSQEELTWILKVIEDLSHAKIRSGQRQQADACELPLPSDSSLILFTDPPYYDAIPYSDFSDFFLVWLKRTISNNILLRDPFDPANPLSPKAREAVQDETKKVDGHPKDREYFQSTMA
jgi:putative DNA methylase